jgi:hypothetical protein
MGMPCVHTLHSSVAKTSSGSRFFAIATQFGDSLTQHCGTLLITTGQSNRKGELKFLEFVITFGRAWSTGGA